MRGPDFNDIVFEKLNKEYGAYTLRKSYNRVVIYSMLAAIFIGCAAVLIPYFSTPKQKSRELFTSRYVTMENLMAPAGEPGAPRERVASAPPPLKKASKALVAELKYVAPVVVDSVRNIDNFMLPTADSLSGISDNEGSINGIEGGTGIGSGGEGGGGGGGGGSGLYSVVDEMPRFKGGDINKFRAWVQRKTVYPYEASANGIQGKVYITFIVEDDGTVSNVKLVRGVDPVIDNEALKSVRSSPKWTPGKQRGRAVRVTYIIQVNFEL
jgi:protein TonB